MPITQGAGLGRTPQDQGMFEIRLTIASNTLENIARCARQGQPHFIVLLHHLTMLQLLPGHAHVS
eukprot:6275996-Prymnesium_polylepis.1